jgi:hypothetical protein
MVQDLKPLSGVDEKKFAENTSRIADVRLPSMLPGENVFQFK